MKTQQRINTQEWWLNFLLILPLDDLDVHNAVDSGNRRDEKVLVLSHTVSKFMFVYKVKFSWLTGSSDESDLLPNRSRSDGDLLDFRTSVWGCRFNWSSIASFCNKYWMRSRTLLPEMEKKYDF